MGAVCAWWRQVALEEEGLLGDLNLCTIPLFSVRALHLPGFPAQRRAFVHWLEARAHVVRALILQAERWEVSSRCPACTHLLPVQMCFFVMQALVVKRQRAVAAAPPL